MHFKGIGLGTISTTGRGCLETEKDILVNYCLQGCEMPVNPVQSSYIQAKKQKWCQTMKPHKQECREECEPYRPKRKAIKTYGIESRRVRSPIAWVREWNAYKWYARESARDKALESLERREESWVKVFPAWTQCEYRKVER